MRTRGFLFRGALPRGTVGRGRLRRRSPTPRCGRGCPASAGGSGLFGRGRGCLGRLGPSLGTCGGGRFGTLRTHRWPIFPPPANSPRHATPRSRRPHRPPVRRVLFGRSAARPKFRSCSSPDDPQWPVSVTIRTTGGVVAVLSSKDVRSRRAASMTSTRQPRRFGTSKGELCLK